MAVVFIKYTYSVDKRQRFVHVKKKHIVEKYWVATYPFEIFLGNSYLDTISLKTSTVSNANHLHIVVTGKKQIKLHNLLSSSLQNIYTYIDASCYKNVSKFIFISSFSCLLRNTRISFYLNLHETKLPSLYSSSKLFKGSTWVERELSELFNINFIGLRDTRRLLTDYTLNINENSEYKTSNYEFITQDLYS